MGVIRTFVAVELSADVKKRCQQLIDKLQATAEKTRFVNADSLHLTLKFLGDVDDREVMKVCSAAADAVESVAPFRLTSKSLGGFPSIERARTIWLGVKEGADELANLHSLLDDKMATLGFPREPRRYAPHITIGRTKTRPTDQMQATMKQFRDFAAGETLVKQVVVFSSFIDRGAPTYNAMSRIDLKGK